MFRSGNRTRSRFNTSRCLKSDSQTHILPASYLSLTLQCTNNGSFLPSRCGRPRRLRTHNILTPMPSQIDISNLPSVCGEPSMLLVYASCSPSHNQNIVTTWALKSIFIPWPNSPGRWTCYDKGSHQIKGIFTKLRIAGALTLTCSTTAWVFMRREPFRGSHGCLPEKERTSSE